MSTRLRGICIAATTIAAAHDAFADRVSVSVVEVAGDVAYVTPGGAAGLAPGAKVSFGAVTATILEVTSATAAIKLDGFSLAIGQTGSVDVEARALGGPASGAPLRAQPQVGGWPEAITPAQVQEVRRVPLGARGRPKGRVHATLIGGAYAAASRDGHSADGEARLIASWDRLGDRPLSADLDVSGRAFTEGYDKQLRVPVFVRAAQLRYGSAIDPRFAIGRLRYAASSVGMLDGARGAVRFGSIQLGAYGGIVPDPVSGKPETSASRFGAEAIYDAAALPWQPRVAVAASGSTWTGELDERRLAIDASAGHDSLFVSGWAEAQSFPAGNPWGARAVELTGAGASAQWRQGPAHVAADVDFLRPERSLRLAAVLPPEWLCSRAPVVGEGTGESCQSGDYTTTATLSAGTRVGKVTFDGYGTVGRTHLISTTFDRSAYVRSEVAIDVHRLVLGASVGKAGFLSWNAGELGAGTRRLAPLDVLVRYRAELLDYVASSGPILMHAVVADARYPYSTAIDLAVSALATTGPDRDALALLATVVWRPLP